MKHISQYMRVLALDPSRQGFGFAVVESRGKLVDWGVARVWGKSDQAFVARVEELVLRYLPVAIALGEPDGRRSPRAARRIRLLASYAHQSRIHALHMSPTDVRATLQRPGATKHEVAETLVDLFPELEPYLPPHRRPWMSEDARMDIFDALALAIAAFGSSLASHLDMDRRVSRDS